MILDTTLNGKEQREIAVRGNFIVVEMDSFENVNDGLIFTFDNRKEIELKQGATYKAIAPFDKFHITNTSDEPNKIKLVILLDGEISTPPVIDIANSGLATENTLSKAELELQSIATQGGPVNASHLASIAQFQAQLYAQMLELKTFTATAARIQKNNYGEFQLQGKAVFSVSSTTNPNPISITDSSYRRILFNITVETTAQRDGSNDYGADVVLKIADIKASNYFLEIPFTFVKSSAFTNQRHIQQTGHFEFILPENDTEEGFQISLRVIDFEAPANQKITFTVQYGIYA